VLPCGMRSSCRCAVVVTLRAASRPTLLQVDTISFGQAIPTTTLQSAVDAVEGADLLIVMGTGLAVAPANQLPGTAILNGVPVVIVNLSDTMYDVHATLCVTAPCGAYMQAVLKRLQQVLVCMPALFKWLLQLMIMSARVLDTFAGLGARIAHHSPRSGLG
jgi:NAD-dependent SIR2 family protein deacetylase